MKEKEIERYVRDTVGFDTSREYDSWVKALAQRIIILAEDARVGVDSKDSYINLLDEVITLSNVAYGIGYKNGWGSGYH